MKIDRIYLDVDGVLADLLPALCEMFNHDPDPRNWPKGKYSVSEVFRIPHDQLWAHVGSIGGSLFWAELSKTPYCDDLIELAARFATRPPAAVTCPQSYPASYAGKSAWLQEHGWKIPETAFLCSEKYELAQPGRVLIDDNIQNCIEWEECGGTALLFPTVANELHEIALVGDVIGYVQTELQRISGRSFGLNRDVTHREGVTV